MNFLNYVYKYIYYKFIKHENGKNKFIAFQHHNRARGTTSKCRKKWVTSIEILSSGNYVRQFAYNINDVFLTFDYMHVTTTLNCFTLSKYFPNPPTYTVPPLHTKL